MKKLLLFVCFSLIAFTQVFAEVTAKKNDDGTVDVTFFYGNPRAEEVVVAGDFTDWQDNAIPMEKGEKGFTVTVQMKSGDVGNYKFISDGNWTPDLRAPMTSDDGFGGKNGHFEVDDLVGSSDGGAPKAKIVFSTWTTMGIQANYKTVEELDRTSKSMALNSVSVGVKSYDKFDGQFIPGCPFHLELALAETDLENYEHSSNSAGQKRGDYLDQNMNYLFNNDSTNDISWGEGFKEFFNGILAHPVSYFSRAKDNQKGESKKELGDDDYLSQGDDDKDSPGFRPIIGHLKFGWDTPVINMQMGFNYGKPDARQAITWTTVDGAWDAGYKHVGGFYQFSLGQWAKDRITELTDGVTIDIGFAPNRSADRKGYNYGLWSWFNIGYGELDIDVQVNGMYGREGMFYQNVEHDVIFGVKDKFAVGDGKLGFSTQWLLATHQRDSDDIKSNKDGVFGASTEGVTDKFGYSTDVFYRDTSFDVQNVAGNVQLGYTCDFFNINATYQFRGFQASMLYIRENHDDNAFLLSDQLGELNSQYVKLDFGIHPIEGMNIGLKFDVCMPLQQLDGKDKEVLGYFTHSEGWYRMRCFSEMEPIWMRDGGAEFTIKPEISYTFSDVGMTIGGYVDMNGQAYDWNEDNEGNSISNSDANKYDQTDSPFRVKKGGLYYNWSYDGEVFKGLDVYYGFDLSNAIRHYNTLAVQVKLYDNLNLYAMIGIKSKNPFSDEDVYGGYNTDDWGGKSYRGVALDSDAKYDSDLNNPFAFAIGISKQFKRAQAPVIYGQFVFNTDPFQHFGGAQESFSLDRANENGSWTKEDHGNVDAVDWYDGRAAFRIGCRWSI